MVTREIRIYDLSGADGAETVQIGYEGVWYELELTARECAALEEVLCPYLSVARRAVDTGARRVVPETTAEERVAIRAWGKGQGLDFAERGRIPRKVIDAYDSAHGIDRQWPEG